MDIDSKPVNINLLIDGSIPCLHKNVNKLSLTPLKNFFS